VACPLSTWGGGGVCHLSKGYRIFRSVGPCQRRARARARPVGLNSPGWSKEGRAVERKALTKLGQHHPCPPPLAARTGLGRHTHCPVAALLAAAPLLLEGLHKRPGPACAVQDTVGSAAGVMVRKWGRERWGGRVHVDRQLLVLAHGTGKARSATTLRGAAMGGAGRRAWMVWCPNDSPSWRTQPYLPMPFDVASYLHAAARRGDQLLPLPGGAHRGFRRRVPHWLDARRVVPHQPSDDWLGGTGPEAEE
jgi:hypothetical protein